MTDSNLKLPHSLEAEKAVLGSVLLAPHRRAELDGSLSTDDFFIPANREVWDAMGACQPLDTVTLMAELERRGVTGRLAGGVTYLLELTRAVGTAENATHYARLVREKAILRRLIALALETSIRAGGECNLGELLTETRAALDKLDVPSEAGPVRVGDALDAVQEAMDARQQAPTKHAVMSGLTALDHVIGGFRAGQVIVVASNPGAGKTSFAWSTAIRAAFEGIPSLAFSLEMKTQEMVERALTFTSRVQGIARGDLDVDKWHEIRAAAGRLRPIPLWVDDRKLSLGRIAGEARRWRSRHARDGRALLVVDYLGLVRSDAKAENRQLEVAGMSRAFKQLSGDLDVPLLLVAQLNRQNVSGGLPREPVLSDLRDSGAIEQDADIVIFPWREPPGAGADPTTATLIVAKHRNGQTGKVNVRWDGELMAFFDAPTGYSDNRDWRDQ
jgi:replicative DNA helicase